MRVNIYGVVGEKAKPIHQELKADLSKIAQAWNTTGKIRS